MKWKFKFSRGLTRENNHVYSTQLQREHVSIFHGWKYTYIHVDFVEKSHNKYSFSEWKLGFTSTILACNMYYSWFSLFRVEYISFNSLYARQNDVNAHVILPGAHRSARHMRRTFDTCFTLSLIYHNFVYVLLVWISYQARFGLKISYPAIVFTMVIGLLNCGSFIVHILLLGTSKVFTLSVFLPCACVHVLLPGTGRIDVWHLAELMINVLHIIASLVLISFPWWADQKIHSMYSRRLVQRSRPYVYTHTCTLRLYLYIRSCSKFLP